MSLCRGELESEKVEVAAVDAVEGERVAVLAGELVVLERSGEAGEEGACVVVEVPAAEEGEADEDG